MTQGRASLSDDRDNDSNTAPPLLRKSSNSVKRTTKGDIIRDVIASGLRNSKKEAAETEVSQNKATMFSAATKAEPEKPQIQKRRSRLDYVLGKK